jgi:hypothetical protein
MKHFTVVIFLLISSVLKAQKPTAAYVRELYKKYPTQKSNLCPACLLWVNPYFKSIGDTLEHKPMLTFYIYTKAHRLQQETLKLPRSGAYSAWHSVYGQPNETLVYREANRIIGKPNSAEMIAKGHCQAWILLAWCLDAALLSDTFTFNAGMEYQGQNIGTELATEELCRRLTGYKARAITDSVKIWCGTHGKKGTYSKKGVTISVPEHYYKVIEYYDSNIGSMITHSYWMPNIADATRKTLVSCQISYSTLVGYLGFSPKEVFNEPLTY